MVLIETRSADTTIVELVGRLDSASAEEFVTRFTALVATGPASAVLDFAQLTYLSSAGFRALLIAAKLMAEAGGSLALCALTPPVHRLFQVSSFDEVFDIFGDREEAVARVSAG